MCGWPELTAGFNLRCQELANQAGNDRDTNNEHLVWIMSCVKVWAWEEATKVNSQQRLLDLEQAWRRGALDDTLKFHVMSKRPGFKASDISWVGRIKKAMILVP